MTGTRPPDDNPKPGQPTGLALILAELEARKQVAQAVYTLPPGFPRKKLLAWAMISCVEGDKA